MRVKSSSPVDMENVRRRALPETVEISLIYNQDTNTNDKIERVMIKMNKKTNILLFRLPFRINNNVI